MTAYIESEGMRLRRKVRALVINEQGEILLVRPHGYREGEWTLAGGGVEDGESPVEAMRRELAEELGVGLDGAAEADIAELPITNRFVYTEEHKVRRGLDHDGQDAVMFACRIGSDSTLVLQAEEIAEARWFAASEASDAFPVAKQKEIFTACLRAIG